MALDRKHALFGLCYVLSEAFMHMHPQFELWPHVGRLRGQTHWWLETRAGWIIDLTAGQYTKPFPYHKGKRCGFLTKAPSRRAQAIMKVLGHPYH